jgi:hypothetical protein
LDINSDGVLDASDIGSVGIEYAESVGQIGLVEIEGVQGSVIAPIAGEGEVIYKQDATSGGAGKRISWEERFPAGIQ